MRGTSPQAVAEAIAEIDRQETRPIRYFERIPRQDLARPAFALAGILTALLLGAKLAERRLAPAGAAHAAPAAIPADMRKAA